MKVAFTSFLMVISILYLPVKSYFYVGESSNPSTFKPKIHKDINKRMLKKALKYNKLVIDESKLTICSRRLSRSQTLQDFFLPSHSKAHFDNCAFQKSINYINRLQLQNDKFAKEFELEDEEKDKKLIKRKILFNTGKILHAMQDFYSHSNYVELMQEKHKLFSDVSVLKIWTEKAQQTILKLKENNGLISGTAWWVFPKKCKKGSPTHAKLAKDTIEYDSGILDTIWKKENSQDLLNGYEAALKLAETSTYEFLLHTFDKYPMLKEHCGTQIAP